MYKIILMMFWGFSNRSKHFSSIKPEIQILVQFVPGLVPFFARSPNHFFSRTACCSRWLSSSIPVYPSDVYLVILGPRASSDYLRLILSNPVYHMSNSVSTLHCLAQSAAQPSLPLAIHNKCSDHRSRPVAQPRRVSSVLA